MNDAKKVIIVPCSGIGKVQGLIAREATYAVTDELDPANAETLCLALLVSGDEEAISKVRETECITVDGCPKLCAFKNLEMAGGRIARSVRVMETLQNHRGAQPGTATSLTDDGWVMVNEIAAAIRGGCEGEVK